MNVNATLIVQGLNFYLFYWIVRVFLFKPVIGYIERIQEEHEALQAVIAQRQEIITEIYHARQEKWQECRQYCSSKVPRLTHLPTIMEHNPSDYPDAHVITPQALTQVVKVGRDLLVARIGGLHD